MFKTLKFTIAVLALCTAHLTLANPALNGKCNHY
jgi:hypothetical protein